MLPPLRPLHADQVLIAVKLAEFSRWSNEALLRSLAPGHRDCLKARPDGTLLDGHHRVMVLRCRGVDVDTLPREIVEKTESSS